MANPIAIEIRLPFASTQRGKSQTRLPVKNLGNAISKAEVYTVVVMFRLAGVLKDPLVNCANNGLLYL